ncbi:hypothetical protein ABES33_29490 [Bacillus pseudomycoides]|uniref:KamA family radical SAM protein n=1 Tax=Bacillus pseudomycoides TaxID=64104 RepID=UPI000BF079A3|nr:lysine 2,3-aminomutase [Bacillus pseudomycoides]PEJ27550.1 lysine 2,3-aminomutase [Bacillus pseudomycoides]PHB30023.1 lysine 2,3-aminomutase [Bacillus pseudomycoides]PHG28072.1 lysine 2,3-aminomutase [Bacillus pseudomycoides]
MKTYVAELNKNIVYTTRNFKNIPQLNEISPHLMKEIEVIGSVLPFKVNSYYLNNLIDWGNVPNDPMFQLVFPNRKMIEEEDYIKLESSIDTGDKALKKELVENIIKKLNPHPGGQMELNVPIVEENALKGIQHKYNETVLFFPKEGQTCHNYCSYCFRWPQFVGDKALRFESKETIELTNYLRSNPNITDVLITGGDPMIMNASKIMHYISPLLEPEFDHIRNIRIGTKALTYWPNRFISDSDSEELLQFFKKIIDSGKSLAIMAHFTHWRELEAPLTQVAIKKIRDVGAIIRSQSPIIGHINNNPETWKILWEKQVQLGIIPYYMFVERDTGSNRYFQVPLIEAYNIYRDAISRVSGLARTARGPVMSTTYGKIEVQGVIEILGVKYFTLRFLQARNIDWINKPFLAKYSNKAMWIDQLEPAFEDKFFFQ